MDLGNGNEEVDNYHTMVRVFANGPEDLGSILGRVIPKTQKMVLDATLLNTQHYKVMIKGKVEQSRGRSSALPYTLDYGWQLIWYEVLVSNTNYF